MAAVRSVYSSSKIEPYFTHLNLWARQFVVLALQLVDLTLPDTEVTARHFNSVRELSTLSFVTQGDSGRQDGPHTAHHALFRLLDFWTCRESVLAASTTTNLSESRSKR